MSGAETDKKRDYVFKRRKLKGLLFEAALPNEYLVQIGAKKVTPVLGGKKFRFFRKFLHIPASIQTLIFSTDNANIHFQGLGIEGFASWQIDPENPIKAIQSLDLFDEDDPMARTNEELKLICIEAVRHVIANMTIDDAHRKKNDIALALKKELEAIEKNWGIVFHQVGIKKVTIMSEKLFNDLQAEFRNEMRLLSEKTRIETDTRIASEENSRNEKEKKEKLESEKNIRNIELANETKLRESKIEQQRIISQKEYDLEVHKKTLEIKLKQENELILLNVMHKVEDAKKSIALIENEINKMRIENEQTFSNEFLMNKMIDNLPAIASKLKIDNYTVLDSSSGSFSPIMKFVQEFISLLQINKIIPKNEDIPENQKTSG